MEDLPANTITNYNNNIFVTLLQHLYRRKFKLIGATNKIIWCSHKQGQAKVALEHWNMELLETYGGKAISKRCFEFFL